MTFCLKIKMHTRNLYFLTRLSPDNHIYKNKNWFFFLSMSYKNLQKNVLPNAIPPVVFKKHYYSAKNYLKFNIIFIQEELISLFFLNLYHINKKSHKEFFLCISLLNTQDFLFETCKWWVKYFFLLFEF